MSQKKTHFTLAFIAVITVFFWVLPQEVHADPIKFIALETSLTTRGSDIDFTTKIPFIFTYPTEDEDGKLNFLTEYFNANFEIKVSGSACEGRVTSWSADLGLTRFAGVIRCKDRIDVPEDLGISTSLFTDLFLDVSHVVRISVNDNSGEILFSSAHQTYPGETQFVATSTRTHIAASTFFSIMRQFTVLGFLHILFGTDHILFILAVHILVRRKREVLLLATSFTIAHSLTLMLASAGVITVTSRIVEPLIALSIAYTAARNMWLYYRGNEEALRERWMTTFGFGLVHGLGFAGALAEIKIPKEFFFSSLLSFNVGVEAGQLVIIAVFVPLLIYIHKKGGFKYALYVLSTLITLVALVWFVMRLFQ